MPRLIRCSCYYFCFFLLLLFFVLMERIRISLKPLIDLQFSFTFHWLMDGWMTCGYLRVCVVRKGDNWRTKSKHYVVVSNNFDVHLLLSGWKLLVVLSTQLTRQHSVNEWKFLRKSIKSWTIAAKCITITIHSIK